MLSLALTCTVVCAVAQDENATRTTVVRKTKTRKPETGAGNTRKPNAPVREAKLTINVDPPGSTIYLDGQQLDTYDPKTGLRLSGLKPGPHTLSVRNFPAYADREQIINLKPGENDPLNITLERLVGKLDIAPMVEDAQIFIKSDDSKFVQSRAYSGRVTGLSLPPGGYDLTISKTGYQTATRRITISPGESIFLEPQLLPLPAPAPSAAPKQAMTAMPSRSRVESEGKFLIVHLHGASGDVGTRLGTINVLLGAAGATVTGALSGQPCQVRFVQLENIAESSLVEAPGPSNQWARIVLRVRPKNTKRPLAFAINWTSLEASSLPQSDLKQDVLVEAIAIEKARPNIPALARSSHATGTVNVLVAIDVHGNVVSAKAVDGPFLFRSAAEDAARRWKFQPATLGGQPTESTQTIGFAFER
jgi:TonB family protein